MENLDRTFDTCPSCGMEIPVTDDAFPGQRLDCRSCGAELTLTFLNDSPDLQLSASITDDDELERFIH
ncbi:MAG: sulfonate ABC transporter [Firmicutes bacterium]|nr:sulfonate ABC transporter [Bacillota bacterium]